MAKRQPSKEVKLNEGETAIVKLLDNYSLGEQHTLLSVGTALVGVEAMRDPRVVMCLLPKLAPVLRVLRADCRKRLAEGFAHA